MILSKAAVQKTFENATINEPTTPFDVQQICKSHEELRGIVVELYELMCMPGKKIDWKKVKSNIEHVLIHAEKESL